MTTADDEDASEVKWVVVYDPLDVPSKARENTVIATGPFDSSEEASKFLHDGTLSGRVVVCYPPQTVSGSNCRSGGRGAYTEDHTIKGMKVLR